MDIQHLLLEMRREQKEDHDRLVAKVDQGFERVAAGAAQHALDNVERFADVDKRLGVVENTRSSIRWAVGTAIGTVLTGIADFLVNHIKH